jgi:two-component system sensor histidine kinase SenX3
LSWRSLRRARAEDEAGPDDFDEVAEDRVRFSETLRALSDGVVVVDDEGVVLVRNAAAARFHDARHGDALAEQAITELLDAAREGDPGERELQLYGPPRESWHVRALPLRDGTRVIGAAAFVRDTSELRRVESVRRDFVANVSHELKTPIGALSVLAETLAESDDPTVIAQLAERMAGEAERLGRIVDDLLDLSLIEAQEAPVREQVEVRALIQEAVERVLPAASAAGISVTVAPCDAEIAVSCDRAQLIGAVTNLLDNAIKYTEGAQPVEIEARDEGDRVAIVVRDRGIGIPRRDLERIFERFYRVDRARSRSTGGTGLGLAIVRHVAQAHGGEVTVDSREGEGSTFRLVLPAPDRLRRVDEPAGRAEAS